MGRAVSRRSILLGAGLLSVVGIFAGGTALGYALKDPESAATTPAGDDLAFRPLAGYQGAADPYANTAAAQETQGSRGGGIPPSARGGAMMDGQDASMAYPDSAKIAPYGLCPAPVGDVLNGGVLDLSAAGFEMKLLGEGFALTSLAVRSEGDCDDEGNATDGALVLDTSWAHGETGFSVQVSQRVQDEPAANMLSPESAQFWAGGYQYTAWVNAYQYYPMEREGPYVDPASDPRIQQVRDAAVGQLAPEIGVQCFFRQEAGDWGDLAALGIGDPRGALPAGFTESHKSIFRLVEPDAGCPGADLEPQANAGFNAGFQLNNGEGWIDVGAWPVYGDVTYPGYIDSYGANWTNGDWQFSVSGNQGATPLGVETIEAIARLLDPNYNAQCFIRERQLTDADLAAIGFLVPTAPEGYSIETSNLRASEVPAGCDLDNVAAPNYYFNWTITNGDNVYDVNVSQMAQGEGTDQYYPVGGWISDYGMTWTNESSGANYSIWGSSRGVTGMPDRDTMVAIALSLDPSLDVSTLSEEPGPGWKPYPMPIDPMPATDSPAPESSSGSGTATAP